MRLMPSLRTGTLKLISRVKKAAIMEKGNHSLGAYSQRNRPKRFFKLKGFKSDATVEHERSLSVNRRAVLANLVFTRLQSPTLPYPAFSPQQNALLYLNSSAFIRVHLRFLTFLASPLRLMRLGEKHFVRFPFVCFVTFSGL